MTYVYHVIELIAFVVLHNVLILTCLQKLHLFEHFLEASFGHSSINHLKSDNSTSFLVLRLPNCAVAACAHLLEKVVASQRILP